MFLVTSSKKDLFYVIKVLRNATWKGKEWRKNAARLWPLLEEYWKAGFRAKIKVKDKNYPNSQKKEHVIWLSRQQSKKK